MEPIPTDPRLQAALEAVIDDDVEELIVAARLQARHRVLARLTDEFAEAMLKRTRRRLSEQEDPPPATIAAAPTTPAAGTTGSAAYVYCVVGADTELPGGLPSIDASHSPRLIRHDQLAAVVSEVPLADFGEERLRERLADMEWLERTARTHEEVLEMIGQDATLIPMRLCSVYHDQDGVKRMLAREAHALADALEHLQGKTEWGVKVFASLPSGVVADREPSASGTDYMQRRRSDRDRRRAADQQLYEVCVEIHEQLATIAADALSSPPQRPEVSGHPGDMLLNGVYLVRDEQRGAFLALVDELHARHAEDDLEVVATGPWPAYNFVPGTIGAAW
jgi:Gas vesicle synthesis protein GvpL/GvpF